MKTGLCQFTSLNCLIPAILIKKEFVMGNWKYILRSGGKLRVKINSDDKFGKL